MQQMRAATLTSYVEVARFVGLDPYECFRRAGIRLADLQDPETRLPARNVVDLLQYSATRSGCECFGLLMAESRTFAQFGPLSLLLERLPTVRDVVRALIQYRRQINDILNISMQDENSTCIIRLEVMPEFVNDQIVDLIIARAYRNIAGASGGRWTPTCVHFVHAPPRDSTEFHRYFPCTIEFESEFDGLSCPSEWMSIRNPLADDAMARNASRLLDLVIVGTEQTPTSDAVRRSIALLLPSGRATLSHVAANLGLSARALQRALEKEGQTYGVLLNEIRRELAQRYLSASSRSITAVSDLTGYASASAFARWFASEFGMAPQNWRSTHVKGDRHGSIH